MPRVIFRWIAFALLFVAAPFASAQSVPVQVSVSGNTATVVIGSQTSPLADMTLAFDSPHALTAANLGINAQLVSTTDPALLARLPGNLTSFDASFPLMVTVEPPAGDLSFDRLVHVEIHTHALTYTYGTSYRLFKAPIGGAFRDITSEVAQGSVRARGTTGGFSQFLILTDVRRTGDVVDEKLQRLRTRIATLAPAEAAPLEAYRAAAAQAVAEGRYDDALASLDALAARTDARAGVAVRNTWNAGGGSTNDAGEILSGVDTAKFSIAYLRNFGH
ncbi:DUF6689 family protein [Cognatilysobacter lacus]|uniref:Uncharacterized protein n=1 Tax=Cognatilysobacter lacus TaxID=1643323 RepID=A0A5D8Z0K8_9GAMM|nr:DUF6689 family protein [Lysobacter lacus]TZF88271.1 hypothetical protein FW784_10120 [Lysobacter lacus]